MTEKIVKTKEDEQSTGKTRPIFNILSLDTKKPNRYLGTVTIMKA